MSACLRGKWATAKWGTSISARAGLVYQELTRINKAISDGQLAKHPALTKFLAELKGERRAASLGPALGRRRHSSQEHLYRAGESREGRGHSPTRFSSRVSRWPR